MQVFSSGIHNDVGRVSDISSWREIKLQQSNYSDNSLFALFRFIDFTFIVQVVLSLFAILFTYDAINGGPEGDGTFKELGPFAKTGSDELRTLSLGICDAHFGDRQNGGSDFRIADSNPLTRTR